MIKILSSIIFFLFAVMLNYAQVPVKVITINPSVGEIITRAVCDNYSILQNYGEFESVMFFKTLENRYYGKFVLVPKRNIKSDSIIYFTRSTILNIAKAVNAKEEKRKVTVKPGFKVAETNVDIDKFISERDTVLPAGEISQLIHRSELSKVLEDVNEFIDLETYPKFSGGIGLGFENAKFAKLEKAINEMKQLLKKSYMILFKRTNSSLYSNPLIYFSVSVAFTKFLEAIAETSLWGGDVEAHTASFMLLFDFEITETSPLTCFLGGGASNYSFHIEQSNSNENRNYISADGGSTGTIITGGFKYPLNNRLNLLVMIGRSFRPKLETVIEGTDIHAAVDFNDYSFGIRLFYEL